MGKLKLREAAPPQGGFFMTTFAATTLTIASLFLPAVTQAASSLDVQRAEMARLGDHYEVQNLFLPNAPSREGMIRISATARQLRAAGYTLRLDKPDMPPVFIGRDGRVHEVGGPIWDGVLAKTWLLHRDKARKFRSGVIAKMRRVASQADLGDGPASESAGDEGRLNVSGRNAGEMGRLRTAMAHSETANVRESAEPTLEDSAAQPRTKNGLSPVSPTVGEAVASPSMDPPASGLDASNGQRSAANVNRFVSTPAPIPHPVLEQGETSGGSAIGRFGFDASNSLGVRRWGWLLLIGAVLIILALRRRGK
ncbi:MAG: hypothetical protein AAB036_10230 [Elusimicrobiota bacterium]